MRAPAIAVVVALGACAAGPKVFAAPAPATALECSLKTAANAGFTPQRGGIADGYFVLQRAIGYTAGDAAKSSAVRLATLGVKGVNRSTGDELTVTSAGGTLRITAAAIDSTARPTIPRARTTTARSARRRAPRTRRCRT